MPTVYLPKNLLTTLKSSFKFTESQDNNNGSKTVYISYNGDNLRFQTPSGFTTPFGMSKYSGEGDAPKQEIEKYTMHISIHQNNRAQVKFKQFLEEINTTILDAAFENSTAWFGVQKKREVIEDLYTPLIHVPVDKETGEPSTKYPPTFRVNVPVRDNHMTIPVYDFENNVMDVDLIPARATVQAIIRLQGIWVVGGKFGPLLRVEQFRVKMPETMGYQFSDDEESETEQEKERIKPRYVDDSDDSS